MTVQHVRKWCCEFCEDHRKVHNEPQSGRPCELTEDTLNTIRAIVEDDQRVSVRQIEFLMKGEMKNPISTAMITAAKRAFERI